MFRNTLGQYVSAVNCYVKVPLTQNQFDALVSFTYNEGPGALGISTLLKKLNSGDYHGAADAFLAWNEITDPKTHIRVKCDALIKRRNDERDYFLKAA